ncbi:MAG: DUF2283 domain-containing protein [Candidatus Aenigmatarchaeota archaeon]
MVCRDVYEVVFHNRIRRIDEKGGKSMTIKEEDIWREDIDQFLPSVSDMVDISKKEVCISYDQEADVVYINFKRSPHHDDSELTGDDIVIRYEEDEIIGLTVLHASKRKI